MSRSMPRIGALACSLALLTAAAQAQTVPAPSPPAPPSAQAPRAIFDDPDVFQRDAWRNKLTDQSRTMPTKARWARARRAAALINADRCAEARALAVAERDKKMAERIDALCAAPAS